jgi:hypothetical protein
VRLLGESRGNVRHRSFLQSLQFGLSRFYQDVGEVIHERDEARGKQNKVEFLASASTRASQLIGTVKPARLLRKKLALAARMLIYLV